MKKRRGKFFTVLVFCAACWFSQGLDAKGTTFIAAVRMVTTGEFNQERFTSLLDRLSTEKLTNMYYVGGRYHQMTLLEIAIQKKNLDAVKILVEKGVDVNRFTADGMPLLCVSSDAQITEYLVENGARVDAESLDKRFNPLNYAVLANYVDVVKVLIAHKVDVNQLDNRGAYRIVLCQKCGNGRSVAHSRDRCNEREL